MSGSDGGYIIRRDAYEKIVETLKFYANERNQVRVCVPPTRGWVNGSDMAQKCLKENFGITSEPMPALQKAVEEERERIRIAFEKACVNRGVFAEIPKQLFDEILNPGTNLETEHHDEEKK